MATRTIKIDQSAFIKDLNIKEDLINYNFNIIPIKTRSAIEIFEADNYNKTNIYTY